MDGCARPATHPMGWKYEGLDPMTAQIATIEHVTLRSPKSFEAVRSTLAASVPPLDNFTRSITMNI